MLPLPPSEPPLPDESVVGATDTVVVASTDVSVVVVVDDEVLGSVLSLLEQPTAKNSAAVLPSTAIAALTWGFIFTHSRSG